MTSPGQKLAWRIRSRRSRQRKLGFLPPLPQCSRCGGQCRTEYWLPFCAACHRVEHGRNGTPHRLRVLADAVLDELRREAREAQP